MGELFDASKKREKQWVCQVRKSNGKECGKKFATLEEMLEHADKKHSGRGREL